MNQRYTKKERDYLAKVKELTCSVCNAHGPSEAHHARQDLPYTCIALCVDCHRDGEMGWHGRRTAWKVRKMDELDALNVTIRRLQK